MTANQFALVERSKSFDKIITQTLCTTSQGQIGIESAYTDLIALLNQNRMNEGTIYLIGNGGSATVASHILTDFINVCHLRATILHDSALITCMANDYGYENSFKQVINTIFTKRDILIAISSSGKSPNICNAANAAIAQGGKVVTYTGFNGDNPLRKVGDMNFWLDSNDYGFVEVGHLFLLHNLIDRMAFVLKTLLPDLVGEQAING